MKQRKQRTQTLATVIEFLLDHSLSFIPLKALCRNLTLTPMLVVGA